MQFVITHRQLQLVWLAFLFSSSSSRKRKKEINKDWHCNLCNMCVCVYRVIELWNYCFKYERRKRRLYNLCIYLELQLCLSFSLFFLIVQLYTCMLWRERGRAGGSWDLVVGQGIRVFSLYLWNIFSFYFNNYCLLAIKTDTLFLFIITHN